MMNGIYLALPVWGRAHVDRMLGYALPSLQRGEGRPEMLAAERELHTWW